MCHMPNLFKGREKWQKRGTDKLEREYVSQEKPKKKSDGEQIGDRKKNSLLSIFSSPVLPPTNSSPKSILQKEIRESLQLKHR